MNAQQKALQTTWFALQAIPLQTLAVILAQSYVRQAMLAANMADPYKD